MSEVVPVPRSIDGGLDPVPLPHGDLGGLWLCGKKVVGPDPEAALVRADRADLIVSFNEAPELRRDYPDYLAWLEGNLGRRSLWYPIPDLGAPPIGEAEEIVAELVARLTGGSSLVLHCAGGIGRAPTMATLVLIDLGMEPGAAGAHIRRHRPMGGPEAGPQRELVERFAARRGH
jgi:protein-tyrosine phosphatase